jgi:CheY-like chemotaxis protein
MLTRCISIQFVPLRRKKLHLALKCVPHLGWRRNVVANILLLETDHILAKNLGIFLRGLGHEISWCVEPQEAIDNADKNPPDVIVLDLMLANHRSGIEFLYEFRSYPEWQNLPVVIFSHVAAEDLRGCLDSLKQLNVAAFRYKPTTSLTELAKSIDEALNLPVKT